MPTITELSPMQVGLLLLGVSVVLFAVANRRKRSKQSARFPEAAALLLAIGALLAIAMSVVPHLIWT